MEKKLKDYTTKELLVVFKKYQAPASGHKLTSYIINSLSIAKVLKSRGILVKVK